MPTIPRPTCWSRFPTKRCRSRRPERGAFVAVALLVASTAFAQTLLNPPKAARCESVVVVRCDAPTGAAAPEVKERARRIDERRRAPLEGIELDRIVIEADPLRPSLADTLSRAFGVRPAAGTHTFSTGEGTQCTCMNPCPPMPLPCCDCSSPMNAFSRTPGGFSPLR